MAWNSRIALFWFAKPFVDSQVYLTITPRGLATAAWECDGERLSPEDAERDLIEAVRVFYSRHILTGKADVGSLARMAPDETPACLAFLAFSVLAAYRMHADEKNRATAYWARLAELLIVDVRRELPMGVSKEGFVSLWQYVSDWTHLGRMTPLFLPATNLVRKYVAYPLGHVALRQVDLERLPEFFSWANYAPGAAVAPDRLRHDFQQWVQLRDPLTRHGRAACEDERADAVLQEVAQELKGWEGFSQDAAGRRVAQVELSLDLVRGMPQLTYLARRPPGFPEFFDDGSRRFDSLDEGWYDKVPVPHEDGGLLLDGFDWQTRYEDSIFVLRRSGLQAIAFVRSEEYTGWTSRRRLLEGVSCAVLYHESVAAIVEERVPKLSGGPPTHFKSASMLPSGWRLFANVKVQQRVNDDVPDLEALEVDAAVEFMTLGGLRLGRRMMWLLDAPPKLVVSGIERSVLVDGRAVRVAPDGAVHWEHLCRTPGVRVVEAGRSHRRIELVEPAVAPDLLAFTKNEDSRYVCTLPIGRWVVLGRTPGEIIHVHQKSEDLAYFGFEPVWGISQGSAGVALYLVDDQRSPNPPTASLSKVKAWIDALLRADDARTPVASFQSCDAAAAAWKTFARAARDLRASDRRGVA